MKVILIAYAAAFFGLVAAQPHGHSHRRDRGSKVDIRADPVVVDGPTETVYELNGKKVDQAEVEQGLRDGIYILLSEPEPEVKPQEFIELPKTQAPPPPPPAPTVAAEVKKPEPTLEAKPEPVKPQPKVEPAPQKAAAPKSGGGSGSEFPSGKIDCSHFPSDYGAMEVDWLKMGGWIGLQKTPGYTPGVSISTIHTGVAGEKCEPGTFCSYSCAPGYQKSQWPTTQGATGQSVGGLYCNSNGKLELTNPDYNTLCIQGTGEVRVKNKLNKNVPICRTDYPGTESETVPLNTQPGQEYEMTCPDAKKYYKWGNAFTSAQYYINPAGSPVEDACRWNEAGSNMGNWAPVNLGVGKGPAGMTYISIFRNAPTNPDGKLNFNIKITGDVSGKCEYHSGTFWSNGAESPSGCTVSSRPSSSPFHVIDAVLTDPQVLVTGVATYELF